MAVPERMNLRSTPGAALSMAPSKYVLLAMTLTFTGIASDTQIVLTPMTSVIATSLHLDSSQVSWVLNVFALGAAVSVGVTSRLGDIIGPRKVLIPMLVSCVVGALICLFSNSFWPLVIGRFMTGLGVGIPLAWGMIRARATEKQLRHVAVLLGSAIALFTPVSLILGGVLLKLGADWRIVFAVVAGVNAATLIAALFSPEAPESVRPRVRLDVPGALGLGVWLTTLLLAVTQGQTWGWGSASVLTLGAVAVVTFCLWVMQQRRAPEPLMAFRGADKKQLIWGYLGQNALNGPAIALFVLLPIMLQLPKSTGFGFGQDQLNSTLPLTMIMPASITSAVVCRSLLGRVGPKPLLLVGGCIGTLAFVGFATVHGEIWNFYLWVFLYAIGLLTCANVGYALAAAAGRQDNMSITFGAQFIGSSVLSTIITAIVLVVLNPAGGHMTEGTFTGIFLAVAIGLALLVAAWAAFLPNRLVDQNAIDVVPPVTPPVPTPVSPMPA